MDSALLTLTPNSINRHYVPSLLQIWKQEQIGRWIFSPRKILCVSTPQIIQSSYTYTLLLILQ